MATQQTHSRPLLGVVVFFLIAFGVPWTGWILLRRTMPLDHMFDSIRTYWFTAAPSVAGFAAAFAEGGLPGLREFSRRVLDVRTSPLPWLLALLLPLSAALLTFVSHPADLLHGGSPKWAGLIGTASLMNFFTGPLAEEFGWRGFLFQKLARRRLHPIWIGVLIAPIWAVWHVPLFYDSVYAHLASAVGYLVWVLAWS